MVIDLNLGVKIISIPTVRDADGLALSSRNKLLNVKDLETAKKIFYNLKNIRHLDYKYAEDLELFLKKQLMNSGFTNIEYLEVREENTLKRPTILKKQKGLRIFVAVYLRNVRLIDNYNFN